MGRIVVFQCDSCHQEYKIPDQVLIVDGVILNGSDEIIYKDNKKKIICKNCLVNLVKNNDCDIEDELEDMLDSDEDIEQESLEDKVVLQIINNEKDEASFINYLGYVTKEAFVKIYSKSLIGCYYPIEESIENITSVIGNCSLDMVPVIHRVLAGIPQIKMLEVTLIKNKKIALINKKYLEES